MDSDFSNLWNDLPFDERKRLAPYQIARQIRHVKQCKRIAVSAHKRHMHELDSWIKDLANASKSLNPTSAPMTLDEHTNMAFGEGYES